MMINTQQPVSTEPGQLHYLAPDDRDSMTRLWEPVSGALLTYNSGFEDGLTDWDRSQGVFTTSAAPSPNGTKVVIPHPEPWVSYRRSITAHTRYLSQHPQPGGSATGNNIQGELSYRTPGVSGADKVQVAIYQREATHPAGLPPDPCNEFTFPLTGVRLDLAPTVSQYRLRSLTYLAGVNAWTSISTPQFSSHTSPNGTGHEQYYTMWIKYMDWNNGHVELDDVRLRDLGAT